MAAVYAVGIGPGGGEGITAEAMRVLEKVPVIAGYNGYLDLIRPLYPDKKYIGTPMRGEAERCRLALEAAQREGDVAMVCSGDAGVYGMAGLLLEMAEGTGVTVRVIPGVTAALSGAALLGAPLGHDFAVISLSDLLTPWEEIEKKLLDTTGYKKVEIEYITDPSLIGGIVIRVGDRVVDGSIRTRLYELKRGLI